MTDNHQKLLTTYDRFTFKIRRGLAGAILTMLRWRNYLYRKFKLGKCFYAEFFTDKFIRNHFFPDYKYRGCVVEVGCATPQLLSMSQHFRESEWRCIGIEPNPKFVALHRALGNEVLEYAAADFTADNHDFVVVEDTDQYSEEHLSAHSYSSLSIKPQFENYKGGALRNFAQTHIKVRVRRLDDILQSHCPELKNIDLLAIDVEGFEIDVMKGFTPSKYNVKVIVLENLFHDQAYDHYMLSIGYRLYYKKGYNYIYVSNSQYTKR
jgi:FkbM family methyltransferase